MPLAAGTKLGPYEVLGLIGAGGMGEVYRARDSRMGRDVAIKVSAARFTERFQVSRDGQRFLFALPVQGSAATAPFTVDTDWREGAPSK